jgi:hypothetical protein
VGSVAGCRDPVEDAAPACVQLKLFHVKHSII